jgi:hypothetical protein
MLLQVQHHMPWFPATALGGPSSCWIPMSQRKESEALSVLSAFLSSSVVQPDERRSLLRSADQQMRSCSNQNGGNARPDIAAEVISSMQQYADLIQVQRQREGRQQQQQVRQHGNVQPVLAASLGPQTAIDAVVGRGNLSLNSSLEACLSCTLSATVVLADLRQILLGSY